MNKLRSMMAFVALLALGGMSTLPVAAEPAPTDQKDKKETTAPKLSFSDDKKEEKKDKGGHVVFSDDKKDEEKEMGGK